MALIIKIILNYCYSFMLIKFMDLTLFVLSDNVNCFEITSCTSGGGGLIQ